VFLTLTISKENIKSREGIRMTDNDIIKALECCEEDSCGCGCPRMYCGDSVIECKAVLMEHALDLINRQKAKIEELYKENARQRAEIEKLAHCCDDCAGCTEWICDCSNIRAEAITEFAERLKEKRNTLFDAILRFNFDNVIDQIAKEMKGEQK
jgi:hypothetical protein